MSGLASLIEFNFSAVKFTAPRAILRNHLPCHLYDKTYSVWNRLKKAAYYIFYMHIIKKKKKLFIILNNDHPMCKDHR